MYRIPRTLNRALPAIGIALFIALCIAAASVLSQCSGKDEPINESASQVSANTSLNTSSVSDKESNATNNAISEETANSEVEAATNYITSARTTGDTYDFVDHVEELLQWPDLSAGCELVSMTCMLNAMGYDVDMVDFAENYVEYGSSYVYTYSGDPYWDGMTYPPALTSFGNYYLSQQDSSFSFVELNGVDFGDLAAYTKRGIPVLIWTTMYMEEPMHTGVVEEEGYEYYENEHCVLVYGIDDDVVYVMDPISGIVERDRDAFEAIYDDCGKMAVTLDA